MKLLTAQKLLKKCKTTSIFCSRGLSICSSSPIPIQWCSALIKRCWKAAKRSWNGWCKIKPAWPAPCRKQASCNPKFIEMLCFRHMFAADLGETATETHYDFFRQCPCCALTCCYQQRPD